MILDKNKAVTFTIDKDEDAIQRSFRATKELMERIVEAENLAIKNEIEANAVVINGRKYGMIKSHPGLTPTIFGMKAETRPDMPDDWDFFIQQRLEPAGSQTNADRIRAMTDEELAEWLEFRDDNCPRAKCPGGSCHKCWLAWLQSPVEEEQT